MRVQLDFEIGRQPDNTTCGPTCLQAVYRYFGDVLPLRTVIDEVPSLSTGGTLGVHLACHALRRGYRARIYTYNLQLFDPTWFALSVGQLRRRLKAQQAAKTDPKLRNASRAYLDFLELGGELRFQDLDKPLIRSYLNRRQPILTGLSATYLYHTSREFGPDGDEDDVRGEPQGHFVVLAGYDRTARTVSVADPLPPSSMASRHRYEVSLDRVIGAILLGIVTYDANMLLIRPA